MTQHQNYHVGSFTDVEQWGDPLWDFLTSTESIQQMTEASDNKRPAAEAIAHRLLAEFGEDIRIRRVKQFIGLLIRQVMEQHNYIWVRDGVKTPDNPVFTEASLYQRRSP